MFGACCLFKYSRCRWDREAGEYERREHVVEVHVERRSGLGMTRGRVAQAGVGR